MIPATHPANPPTSLIQAVPLAGPNSDGRRCSRSPASIHDSIPGPKGQDEDIVGIAKVMKGGQVVGFIYRTASGRFYAQALAAMPYEDQKKAAIIVEERTLGVKLKGFAESGFSEIKKAPWSDLRIVRCH